jgi:hypothetical protein
MREYPSIRDTKTARLAQEYWAKHLAPKPEQQVNWDDEMKQMIDEEHGEVAESG